MELKLIRNNSKRNLFSGIDPFNNFENKEDVLCSSKLNLKSELSM